MKGMVAPGTLFEEMGWHYIGPLDGHDLPSLVEVLKRVSSLNGPQILHIRTIKGKGFTPAEEDPVGYHALGKSNPRKKWRRRRQQHQNHPNTKMYLVSGCVILPRSTRCWLESHLPCAKAPAW